MVPVVVRYYHADRYTYVLYNTNWYITNQQMNAASRKLIAIGMYMPVLYGRVHVLLHVPVHVPVDLDLVLLRSSTGRYSSMCIAGL